MFSTLLFKVNDHVLKGAEKRSDADLAHENFEVFMRRT